MGCGSILDHIENTVKCGVKYSLYPIPFLAVFYYLHTRLAKPSHVSLLESQVPPAWLSPFCA